MTDETWLRDHGVQGTSGQLKKLEKLAMSELEMRVGTELAEKLSTAQLDEFDIIEDEDERLAWLEKAYPSYKKVVEKQHKKMGDEIAGAKDKKSLIESWESFR